jgi:hypothetical protein
VVAYRGHLVEAPGPPGPRPGLSRALNCGVPEDVQQRHITVTNYCPVLDRFIEKNLGYAPLIDSGNPGNWPKSGRNAPGATRM